jgi:ATP-binding cassette subfamily B multidrug efflux pump
VMEDGQIVEQGTHQELLEARGHYFDLYNSQFTEAIEEPEEERPGVPAAAGVGPGPRGF